MSEKPRWIFIVNPVAGNGFAAGLLPEIKQMIAKYNINADVVQTERSGHAEELSFKYLNLGYKYIIGVGGDGTFNEIARPLIGKTEITAGLIPAGTGNDFIQILGFPNRFTENEWDVFFRCNTISMDAGSCNGRIFVNGMGLGFDAMVAAENYTETGKVKKGGTHKYIWHILKTLLFFKEQKMIISEQGTITETDCFINTVGNGRRFAGDFFLTPSAIANDGLLDICSINRLSLLHRLRLLLKVPKGEHLTDPAVRYFQTKEIELEFSQKVPFHLDGELYYSSHFMVKTIFSALNTIYNPDGKHYFRQ